MADTERSLGWLHLTDLHVGQPREGGRVANIERALLDDLGRVFDTEQQSISVIFFSGDIAFKGSDAEYVRASAILGRICAFVADRNARLNPGDPAEDHIPLLVPVPGNHDLVRPPPDTAETIRTAFRSRTAGSPPLWTSGQESVRRLIDAAFRPYTTWLDRHPLPFPPGARQGALPGDLSTRIVRGGISLGVVGLNSTYLHLGDAEPGELHLDLSQLTALLGANPRASIEASDFNVLVTHHPPWWLSPVARTALDQEIKPDHLFDLHLFGHDHLGGHDHDPGTSGIRHLVQGRSLFGAEEGKSGRLHGYTVGRFVLGALKGEKRPKRVEVWARHGWSDGHGWRFGPVDERWGRWRLHIELGEARAGSPARSPTPTRYRKAVGELGSTDAWKPVASPPDLAAHLAAQPVKRWILLSGGVPPETLPASRLAESGAFLESVRRAEIVGFARALTARIAATENLGLVFGGEPGLTQAISPDILAAKRGSPWVTLVQDQYFLLTLLEEVGVIAASDHVLPCLVPNDGSAMRLGDLRAALCATPGLVGAVFVGGMKGVVDEFHLVGKLCPDVPRIAVGLGGGAAASLLLDEKTQVDALGTTGGSKKRGPRVKVPAKLWHTPTLAVDAIFEALALNPSKRP